MSGYVSLCTLICVLQTSSYINDWGLCCCLCSRVIAASFLSGPSCVTLRLCSREGLRACVCIRECWFMNVCRSAGVYLSSMSCARECVDLPLVCFVDCRLIITSSSLRLAVKGRESKDWKREEHRERDG